MSLYNPAGLLELSIDVMMLSRSDPATARIKLASMQEVMRALIAQERRQADAATTQQQHRTAIAHETVVVMVLRSYPCLPEVGAELETSFLRIARSFGALDEPLAAGWATALAQGRVMRFGCSASCQIAVLPALYNAFLPATPGWFVEIGAYDGTTFSNTASLADVGWNGLYVEPHPYYLSLAQRRHASNPATRFEHCAVGCAAGTGMISDDGAMSRLASDAPGAPPGSGSATPVVPTPVAIERLDTLLEKHAVPRGFELLVIDVEGHEEAVFDGFDLAAWRPRLLIVELGEVDHKVPAPDDPRWRVHQRVTDAGYRVVYQDSINTVYVAP